MSFSIERIIEDTFSTQDNKVKKLLSEYLNLLFKWHDVKNIVSSSDIEYVIKREIYDSFQLNKYLNGNSFSDIGSGGGIPGIIISILNPDKKVLLIDRKSTFIDFLTLAKAELNLKNVEVINRDVIRSQMRFSTESVLLKNFSNKLISKMNLSLIHI